jgi:hypothetical protein
MSLRSLTRCWPDPQLEGNVKIYDIRDDGGRLLAFEIDNALVQPRGIERLVRTLPEAVVAPCEKGARIDGERYRFEVSGTTFIVWEPFGDNSRFWVGPEPTTFTPTTAVVRAAFAEHNPAIWFQVGCLLAGVSVLAGCAIVLGHRFGPFPDAWAGVGVAALAGGAIAAFFLLLVGLLGLEGQSKRTLRQLVSPRD